MEERRRISLERNTGSEMKTEQRKLKEKENDREEIQWIHVRNGLCSYACGLRLLRFNGC